MPEEAPGTSGIGDGRVRRIPLARTLPADTRPLPALSAGQTEGLRPLPWKEVSIQDDGRRIVILVTAAIHSLKGVHITEDEDAVSLVVYGPAPHAEFSTAALIHTLTLVELPEALGTRRLTGP